jgi:N4-gp56 family major capsid protein
MANTYTSTDVSSLGTSLVQTAYDRKIRFALRAEVLFRQIADSRPEQQAMPGSSVVFQFYNDLSAATTELTETIDPDATGVPSTTSVSVTLREYGNTVLETRKLRLVSLSDVDEAVANMVAYNMRDSLDGIVGPILNGGTHVIRRNSSTVRSDMISAGAGTTGAVTSSDTINSPMVRLGVTKLRGNKVIPKMGSLYCCYIHPDVSHDL